MRPLAFFSLLVLLAGLWIMPQPAVYAQSPAVLTLRIEGPVTPPMADYFERGIQEAENSHAAALLIELNTPGGSFDTTMRIVQDFRNASVPVIVYVSPNGAQAASAGSIITAAAHASGMAPETIIGAASPVNSNGGDLDETMKAKLMQDLKATMRSLTQQRGAEATALAEEMIESARAVSASEALRVGFIDAVAVDGPDLLAQLDGLKVLVNGQEQVLATAVTQRTPFAMNWIERILYFLTNPLLIGVLFSIGVFAIIIEISVPGGWVSGFTGIICLGLALYGAGQLPVNWLGAGLIVLAFALFIIEIKVVTHGAVALTGIATFFVGLLVLFNSPGSPSFAHISIGGALGLSFANALIFIAMITIALRAQNRPSIMGEEGLLGQLGEVRLAAKEPHDGSAIYAGQAFVNGAIWRVEATEHIERGDQIEVKGITGLTLKVKKKTN